MSAVPVNQPKPDQETYRDSIATVDQEGKRLWMYPKRQHGAFWRKRTYLSWILLAILFGLPFLKLNGDPLVLFNVLERRFIIFGIHFTPQDFHLFAILMITGVVFIALFTVVWGRLFCGWVCPQTIFMEGVFRKIEYWIEGDAGAQRRLNKAPWTRDKIVKKVGKQVVFFAISLLIAHTFLSYIIGWENVRDLVSQAPSQDWVGFGAMLTFTFLFYGVFAYMREQVCIAICPYGRLQGVLTGNDTIAVMYDWIRGEPRGKIQRQKKAPKPAKKSSCSSCPNCAKGEGCSEDVMAKLEADLSSQADLTSPAPLVEETPVIQLGDCIDCKLCVQVCPTGIDIRNGTQLECINCTLCIDACDEVMTKINRPTGLIRYDSYHGVQKQERKIWRPRVIAYSAVLLALISLNVVLLSNRSPINTTINRTPGLLYNRNEDGSLNNLYKYQLMNKTGEAMPIEFRLDKSLEGNIRLVGSPPIAQPGEVAEGVLFIDLPADNPTGVKSERIEVEIWSNGQQLDEETVSFIRPPN
ncbi:MAG: 4Fe-4S dicluster domain-containing protein [Bacteroidota bacterium]